MNILIIDDHQVLKEGLINRFKKIVPEATCFFVDNVRCALSKIQCLKIDLILCDLEFNNDVNNDGFFIIESILAFEPRTKAIAFTNYNSYRIMKKAMASGFLSFLDKGCTFNTFKETISNVLDKGAYKSETMCKLFKSRNQFTCSIFSDSIYGVSDLSEKELELVILTRETTDRQELALMMNNKPYTIDSHFKKITNKLNLKNRKEIAFFCVEFYTELLKAKDSFNSQKEEI
jgi:two-component system capsular synthesis response regulator RcsB